MASFCVIRRFKEGDQFSIKDIITESVMEQVSSYFWRACFSELFPQIAMTFVATSYIFLGVPLKWALLFGPGSLIFILVATYLGHFVKAQELNSDLDNIPNNYMKENSTTFLVAEYYGRVGEAEIASLMNKPKKFEYNFYTEREFQLGNVNAVGLNKMVVGCVAITKSMCTSESAWLRRMAVSKPYRRRRIGTHLLKEAIKFCEQQKYKGIELITTDNHDAAKQLYWNEGFLNSQSRQKSFLGFGGILLSFKMYRPLTKSEEIEGASESQTKAENESQTKAENEKDLLQF